VTISHLLSAAANVKVLGKSSFVFGLCLKIMISRLLNGIARRHKGIFQSQALPL
jgi:hypothetical protein